VRVTVKLFATFRRYLPEGAQDGRCEIALPAGAQVAEALAASGLPVSAFQGAVILVNGRTAHPDQGLHPHDVVTAFPAMAGGSA
jgi:molybdopterin converting factor small subunit